MIQREHENKKIQEERENLKNKSPSAGTTNLIHSGLTSGTGNIELHKFKQNMNTKPLFKHKLKKLAEKTTAKQIVSSEEHDETEQFVNINYLNMQPLQDHDQRYGYS